MPSRLTPDREDHLRRNRHAEPGHDHSGDRGCPAGETGSAAGAGPDAQAARVPGISPNTARAALAGDGPPRGVRHPAGSVADEVEPRVWPYVLPAGWRRATELDGPAVSAQKCRDGSQDRRRLPGAGLPDPGADNATLRGAEPRAGRARPRRILDARGVLHRLHDIVAGIWHLEGVVPVRDRLTYPQVGCRAHRPGPLLSRTSGGACSGIAWLRTVGEPRLHLPDRTALPVSTAPCDHRGQRQVASPRTVRYGQTCRPPADRRGRRSGPYAPSLNQTTPL